MGEKSNLKVFTFLCAVEGIISLKCVLVNIFCFLDPNEPHPLHQSMFLFVYLAFCLLAPIQIIKMATEGAVAETIEAASATCGFTFFIIASNIAMYDVEKDEHLNSMTDREEAQHLFFLYNRYQSVLSLVNALIFLMHALYAFDLIKTSPKDKTSSDTKYDDEEMLLDNSLKLHFYFVDVWHAVKKICRENAQN